MPLNKFAPWGAAPLAPLRPPGLTAVVRAGFNALNTTIQKMPASNRNGGSIAVPSATGLLVVWSLGAVRNALCDQHEPQRDTTNAQIETRAASDAVVEIAALLGQFYPLLARLYGQQFRLLEHSEALAFDQERRERLAELLAFELEAMATVSDLSPSPATRSQPPRTAKRR